MSKPIPRVTNIQKYFEPDGRLTAEGLMLFQLMLEVLRDFEARITALEP
ncbi:hypothetical protein OU789_10825 [Halocynthiibacter sp. C4]|nr:hypothetical protein [Halocynthiibacter sp. C4]MDE0590420.1 hypothetical protein [Halocynthiibacter sp. C4]